jgi:flagellar basal-body rod protein FlgC
MDFMKSISVATSGLRAQAGRMRVIAENLANADSIATRPGADPYRRKIATFERHFDRETGTDVVKLGRIRRDEAQFRTRFEPGHPAADPNGNVKLPNVNSVVESMDLREAQRTYEANLNVVTATRRMMQRTIDILRG